MVQQALFTDDLVLVARPGHPLVGHAVPDLAALARHPWVLPPEGTPSRAHFERFMAPLPAGARPAIIESSSPILMRELLGMTDHIGCISRLQAGAEIALGALKPLAVRLPGSMLTLPCCGSISPERIFRKVDLPAPLAPITP